MYKPFNLDEALAGKPVITRDGRPVKIAGYNEDAFDGKKVIGWVGKDAEMWQESGQYYGSVYACNFDLFMAPTTRKEWIVRSSGGGIFVPFKTKQEAEIHHLVDMGGTIHEITITE
jgi:hypothetical protein